MSKRFTTNPQLLVFQSRLYNPTYSGSGKWAIFQPDGRRAFLAVGKDILPPAISLLAQGSRHSLSSDDVRTGESGVTPEQFRQIVEAGLLQPAADSNGKRYRGFLHAYQQAVFDYPFFDYTDATWLEKDRALMRRYAQMWEPPPMKTPREGMFYRLPQVFPHDLHPDSPASADPLPLRALAAILRFTFGPTLEFMTDLGPWIRKTSPSGGARHPTEGIVFLSQPYGSAPPGVYVYDVERHGLVSVEHEYPDTLPLLQDGSSLAILLRSRVERPMWRYREIRSFRPILLDAGHVAETLALLLGLWGMATRIDPPIPSSAQSCAWITEPELALVVAARPEVIPQRLHTGGASRPFGTDGTSSRYLTKPSLYLTFGGGAMHGHVAMPERSEAPISLRQFEALTHCLPSRRGDRITSPNGILAAVPGLSESDLSDLVASHALVPAEAAQPFYAAMELWVRHGWYLSFLAHLTVRSSYGAQSAAADRGSISCLGETDVTASLLERRTTRSFARRPISRAQLFDVLAAAGDLIEGTDDRALRLELFVAILLGEDVAPGLYRWNATEHQIHSLGTILTRNDIRSLTIGQGWAGSGAAALWLVLELDPAAPERYELDLLHLGRVGQRLCLAATQQRLGIFLTPAVNDQRTFQALQVSRPTESVAYFFAVGHPTKAQAVRNW